MKGILLKDFYLLQKQYKMILILFVLYFVLSFTGTGMYFIMGFLSTFLAMQTISLLAYDEQSHFEKFALTMPIHKKDIVKSKYILLILLAFVGALVCLFGLTIAILVNKEAGDMNSILIFSGLSFLVSIAFNSICLPAVYKFGVEKGRMAFFVIGMVPVLLMYFLSLLNLKEPSKEFLDILEQLLAYILIAISILTVTVSYFISKHIVEKREVI